MTRQQGEPPNWRELREGYKDDRERGIDPVTPPDNPEDNAYVAAKESVQEHLPLPPPEERGAVSGFKDFVERQPIPEETAS